MLSGLIFSLEETVGPSLSPSNTKIHAGCKNWESLWTYLYYNLLTKGPNNRQQNYILDSWYKLQIQANKTGQHGLNVIYDKALNYPAHIERVFFEGRFNVPCIPSKNTYFSPRLGWQDENFSDFYCNEFYCLQKLKLKTSYTTPRMESQFSQAGHEKLTFVLLRKSI